MREMTAVLSLFLLLLGGYRSANGQVIGVVPREVGVSTAPVVVAAVPPPAPAVLSPEEILRLRASLGDSLTAVVLEKMVDPGSEEEVPVTPAVHVPNLSGLTLSAELVSRAEDLSAGHFVSPSAIGVFEELLLGHAASTFRGWWMVRLTFQAPSSAEDTLSFVNRIVSSGGAGTLSIGGRIGWFGSDNRTGIVLVPDASFSWTGSKELEGAITEGFSMGRLRGTLAAWAGPMIATYDVSSLRAMNLAEGSFKESLEESLASALSVIIKFNITGSEQAQYLQLRYLLPSEERAARNNFEARFLTTLNVF